MENSTKPSKHKTPEIVAPTPTRQIGFYQLLVAARKQWLMDALAEALGQVDQGAVKTQIAQYVLGRGRSEG